MSEQTAGTAANESPAPTTPTGVLPGPDDGVDGVVSRSAVVHTDPSEIFAFLADARRHRDLDGSGSVRGPFGGVGKLYLGRKLTMHMAQGWFHYPVPLTITEFDTDRRIAWRHVAGHVWRWTLTPQGPGATLVTETFDPRPSPLRGPLAQAGSANAVGIEATLRGLQERFPG